MSNNAEEKSPQNKENISSDKKPPETQENNLKPETQISDQIKSNENKTENFSNSARKYTREEILAIRMNETCLNSVLKLTNSKLISPNLSLPMAKTEKSKTENEIKKEERFFVINRFGAKTNRFGNVHSNNKSDRFGKPFEKQHNDHFRGRRVDFHYNQKRSEKRDFYPKKQPQAVESPVMASISVSKTPEIAPGFEHRSEKASNWWYLDPDHNVRGPYGDKAMQRWYEAGYFNSDLMIKNGVDSDFSALGSWFQSGRKAFLPFCPSNYEIKKHNEEHEIKFNFQRKENEIIYNLNKEQELKQRENVFALQSENQALIYDQNRKHLMSLPVSDAKNDSSHLIYSHNNHSNERYLGQNNVDLGFSCDNNLDSDKNMYSSFNRPQISENTHETFSSTSIPKISQHYTLNEPVSDWQNQYTKTQENIKNLSFSHENISEPICNVLTNQDYLLNASSLPSNPIPSHSIPSLDHLNENFGVKTDKNNDDEANFMYANEDFNTKDHEIYEKDNNQTIINEKTESFVHEKVLSQNEKSKNVWSQQTETHKSLSEIQKEQETYEKRRKDLENEQQKAFLELKQNSNKKENVWKTANSVQNNRVLSFEEIQKSEELLNHKNAEKTLASLVSKKNNVQMVGKWNKVASSKTSPIQKREKEIQKKSNISSNFVQKPPNKATKTTKKNINHNNNTKKGKNSAQNMKTEKNDILNTKKSEVKNLNKKKLTKKNESTSFIGKGKKTEKVKAIQTKEQSEKNRQIPKKKSSGTNEFGAPQMPQEFRKWCQNNLYKITGSKDMTLIDFVLTLDNPNEIRSYIVQYHNKHAGIYEFADDFIAQKAFYQANECGKSVQKTVKRRNKKKTKKETTSTH